MSNRFKTVDGKIVEAIDLSIIDEVAKEITFALSDGAIIKIRLIASFPKRSKTAKNPVGEPYYSISISTLVETTTPSELKTKIKGNKLGESPEVM